MVSALTGAITTLVMFSSGGGAMSLIGLRYSSLSPLLSTLLLKMGEQETFKGKIFTALSPQFQP